MFFFFNFGQFHFLEKKVVKMIKHGNQRYLIIWREWKMKLQKLHEYDSYNEWERLSSVKSKNNSRLSENMRVTLMDWSMSGHK